MSTYSYYIPVVATATNIFFDAVRASRQAPAFHLWFHGPVAGWRGVPKDFPGAKSSWDDYRGAKERPFLKRSQRVGTSENGCRLEDDPFPFGPWEGLFSGAFAVSFYFLVHLLEFGSWSPGLPLVFLHWNRGFWASLGVHVSTRAIIWMDFNFHTWFFRHFRGCNSNMYFSQKVILMERIRSTIPTSEDPIGGCIILRGMDLHRCQDFVENQLYTAMKEALASGLIGFLGRRSLVMLKGGMFGGYPPWERVHILLL